MSIGVVLITLGNSPMVEVFLAVEPFNDKRLQSIALTCAIKGSVVRLQPIAVIEVMVTDSDELETSVRGK